MQLKHVGARKVRLNNKGGKNMGWDDDEIMDVDEIVEDEEDEIAQSIDKLAEAMKSVADEIREFRHDLLRDEWLRVVVQGGITQEGKIRYDMR
jgi:hypothetical protein